MRTPACFLASILVLTASPVFAQTNVGSCDYLGEQHDGSWSFYTIDATSQGVSSDRAIRIHDNPTAVCGHDGAQNGAGFYCGETDHEWVWVAVPCMVVDPEPDPEPEPEGDDDDCGEGNCVDAVAPTPTMLTLTIEDNDVTPVPALPLLWQLLLGLGLLGSGARQLYRRQHVPPEA